MRKFSLTLLVLFVFSVYAEDEKEMVIGSAKELKGVSAKKITWKKDEAKMVPIPGGNKTKPFWIDTTEVTVGQFKKFLLESDHQFDTKLWRDIYRFSATDKSPIIYVSWDDAVAYAKWAGKRLPREEEWEWAARGGLKGKIYPWGDNHSQARDYANYDGADGKDKWKYCAPVGSFEANGYGLHDMAGNVWEWTQDWYDDNRTRYRLLRGGCWINDIKALSVANRFVAVPLRILGKATSDFGALCQGPPS